MSPSAIREAAATETFEDDLNLSLVGLGVQYPDFHNGPEALETLAKRHYPESNVYVKTVLDTLAPWDAVYIMTKVLSINRFTGIEKRSAIGTCEHPLVNRPEPPTIRELNELFMNDGVRMAVGASQKAMAEWGGVPDDITHMVATTCTNSANPGYDHFVAKELGLSPSTQKVLLHGIGCSGGLAAIRTAANLALGSTARRRPARILVVACEVSSVFVRSELESIHHEQEVRIGPCLFSDCASACVVSNGIGDLEGETAGACSFEILGWHHKLIDDTAHDLGFDVDPLGWKVILTPRVPPLTCQATPPAFRSLISSIPSLLESEKSLDAQEFTWALHPGGSTILSSIQSTMGLTENHLLASYQVYVEHGNSSSATIMSVMDTLRKNAASDIGVLDSNKILDGRGVVAAAFGPGISLEMMMLRRGNQMPGAAELQSAAGNGHANGTHPNGPSNGQTNGHVNGETVNGVHEKNGSIHQNGSNGHASQATSVEADLAGLQVEDVD